LNIVWVCWLFTRLPGLSGSRKALASFIKTGLVIFLVVILSAKLLGYHRLAEFLISRLGFTFLSIGVLWIVFNLVGRLEWFINHAKGRMSESIRFYLGFQPPKKLTEFLFIKITVFVVSIYTFVMFVLFIWGMPVGMISDLDEALLAGFTVAKLTLVPSRIVIGLFLFALFLMIGRYISSAVKRHRTASAEREVQNTMDSLLTYILFGLSLILALFIAGVDFTALAFIAGAFTVGIGFGLQNIVNNFISGIILLLDKNVNPGDLVLVNGVEGIIRKISLRSTQIRTLSKEDVIVPNTELFTSKVTNYMLHGKTGRIVCRIGVARGTDIEVIEKLLLEVANKHEGVLQDEKNQPTVLFKEFSSGSLSFALIITVPDVKKKQQIVSSLNAEIEKALEENKIDINFISG